MWGEFSTGGSRGIRESHEYVRQGGAAAREMLMQAAANQWKVPVAEFTVANGVITHQASNRSTSYGKVAEAAAKLTAPDPKSIKLKDPKDWKIAGKPVKRLDIAEHDHRPAGLRRDLKLPGMLKATIKDCPVFGGKVKSFDAAKVTGMPGVKHVLKVGETAVAVVADTWWQANAALEALPIVWDEGENAKVSSESIAAWLKEGLDAEQAFVGNQNGDAKAAIAGAAKKVEAVYAYPYQNHALHGADERHRALHGGQVRGVGADAGRRSIVRGGAGGIGPAGRRNARCTRSISAAASAGAEPFQDYVHQAVHIAKQIPGTPVKLLWSREEDMTHGRYHPVMQCKLVGAFDKDNNLTGLHMRLSGQSILAAVRPQILEQQKGRDPLTFQGVHRVGRARVRLHVPNLLIDHSMRNPHVPPGFWRGVNINQNAIFLECFMDELAQAAGQDALEFRRKLMSKHPRNLAVLNAVAERIGWGKPAPQGVYRGLAHMMAFDSYVAARRRFPSPAATRSRSTASSAPPTAPTRSTRRRSTGRWRVRSSTACPRCSIRSAPSRTAASCRRTSTPTTRCASPKCRRSNRSSCRPAARPVGRRGRADDLCGGARGAQCVLQGDGPAHPLVPAEEPQYPDGLMPPFQVLVER